MLRHQRLLVLVLLFVVSACSQKPGSLSEADATPTFTPYVGGTETAQAASEISTLAILPTIQFNNTPIPIPTFDLSTPAALSTAEFIPYPTITPSSTPLITLTPTTTPTGVVLPSGFSPVLLGKKYDRNTFFTLLGGVQGGKWLTPDQAATQITGASEYDVYTLTKGMVQVYGYAPHRSQISPLYILDTDAMLSEIGMIGVVHGWRARQGDVEELSSANEPYRQVVLDWLSQAGVADPQIGTIQIFRTDLEGDGTDEIFISSTRVESQHTTQVGDHSIILMRKVIGNVVVTVPILVDMYASVKPENPFPCTYTVGNFIDLNQDGVLEVMVEYERWEGFGAVVYQVSGQNVNQVLGSTCMTP